MSLRSHGPRYDDRLASPGATAKFISRCAPHVVPAHCPRPSPFILSPRRDKLGGWRAFGAGRGLSVDDGRSPHGLGGVRPGRPLPAVRQRPGAGAVHAVTLADGHDGLVARYEEACTALNDPRFSKDMHAALALGSDVVAEGFPAGLRPAHAQRRSAGPHPVASPGLGGLPRRIEGLRPGSSPSWTTSSTISPLRARDPCRSGGGVRLPCCSFTVICAFGVPCSTGARWAAAWSPSWSRRRRRLPTHGPRRRRTPWWRCWRRSSRPSGAPRRTTSSAGC